MKGTHKPSLAYSRAMDSVNVASDDGMTRELLEQADREVEAEIAANRREAERRAFEAGLARLRASFPTTGCRDCGAPCKGRRCFECEREWAQAQADNEVEMEVDGGEDNEGSDHD